jgi:hypothetical protein
MSMSREFIGKHQHRKVPMPPMTIHPKDLLHYNPTHLILICLECQYAIQKSAVSSHLLRHKIYREERQQLLSYVTNLNLLEPEDVSLPPPESPPIEGLPIITGYRCVQDGCRSLCASLKRMRKHQSEIHGVRNLGDVAEVARPAELQTFFRGTKLRYFEVSTTTANSHGESAKQVKDSDESVCSSKNGTRPRWKIHAASQETDVPASENSWLNGLGTAKGLGKGSLVDLDTLRYFHHYTTTTSHTLPGPQGDSTFWLVTVVELALKHQWLMCGLLAISASHLATSVDTSSGKEAHGQSSARFHAAFSSGLADFEISRVPSDEQVEKRWVARRIECILRFVSWTSIPRNVNNSSRDPAFGLQPLVTTLRDLTRLNSNSLPHSNNVHQEAIFAEAKRILEADPTSPWSCQNPTCKKLLDRLRVLPEQLSQALGRPDNVQDVLTTLLATAALVVSCEFSSRSDTAGATWQGVVGWLAMVAGHFNSMLDNSNPAALVLVAYWSILIRRVESFGMWFLQDLGELVVRVVKNYLANSDKGLRGLISDLSL